MIDIVFKMNDVLNAWKQTFEFMDIRQDVSFTEDEQGYLFFKGILLRPTSDLTLISSNYDINTITYDFAGGIRLILTVRWPEDKAPYIDSVLLRYLTH